MNPTDLAELIELTNAHAVLCKAEDGKPLGKWTNRPGTSDHPRPLPQETTFN